MKNQNQNQKQKPQNPFRQASVQLCRLEHSLPKEDDWLFELKYDGYRMLAYADSGKVTFVSRGGQDYTQKLSTLQESLEKLGKGRTFVLDGEVVVTDDEGKSDFQALQSYFKHTSDKVLSYIVFDILALDGVDLRKLPLSERKKKLQKLLQNCPKNIHLCKYSTVFTQKDLDALCAGGYEGIVCKRQNSIYSGSRNGDWIKIKCINEEEFVVVGFTSEKRGVSSVLLGQYEGNSLIYAGSAGTGISYSEEKDLQKAFASLTRESSPLQNPPSKKGVTWLAPKLRAKISFAERTEEGLLRHPSFQGLCKYISVTNPEKIMFPKVKISKGGVAQYYRTVSEYMLPFMENRLLSLVRCPRGVEKSCFYKKHPTESHEGLKRVTVKNSEGEKKEYYCILDTEGLLHEVQMNTLEFHVWGSNADNPDKPDIMVFDLDPDEGMSIDRVRQGVEDIKSVLDGLGLQSFLKTSGGKGFHIVVPFAASSGWEEFSAFSKKIAQIAEQKWADKYTTNIRKAARKGRIFIDYLRNTKGATSVAPYSLRAKEGGTASVPIAWDALYTTPPNTTMQYCLDTLEKNPWKDFFAVKKTQKLK